LDLFDPIRTPHLSLETSMSRKLLMVAALSVLALPVTAAHAQMGFGVAAGLSAPMGDFKDAVDAGYHLTGMLTFAAPLAPVGLRVEGSFNEFNFKSTVISDAKERILSGTANAVISTPGMMGFYVIGGLGEYHVTASCSAGCDGSINKFGFNGGAGFKFGLSGFSAFVEARYHTFDSGSNNAGRISYVPVSFGVTF
jgi:outer membrane protein with beta-barrel domain